MTTKKTKTASSKINLLEYDYPKPTGADMVFPTYDAIPELLEEAKVRGFLHGHTPYNDLFSNLFFNGGKVVFKEDVDPEKLKVIWVYVRSFMGSWSPKHEHKEAICAMIMSEILEPKLDEK